MKKIYITMLFAAVAALLMTGCQTEIPGATITDDGKIVFSATGQSVAETESLINVIKAEMAASTVAKANLLEAVKGALVSSSVKVDDLMFTSQTAENVVNGWLARAVVTINEVEEVVVEETKLPKEPVVEPSEKIITATATLTLSKEDLKELKQFVE